MARICIIINCLNGEKYLQETLNTVKNQTFTDWEIIFLDNCSIDSTPTIAKAFGDKLHYYRTDKTIPLGEARNIALSYATSEWIAFLDSDDLWAEDKLEKQMDIADKVNDISLIMSNFYSYNMMRERTQLVHTDWTDKRLQFKEFVCNYSYSLSTFLIKRDAITKLDMWFDERFEYAEEYDFFCRLAYYGDVYRIAKPLATRRMHRDMTTLKLAKRIPIEHQMTLENLQKLDKDFDSKNPEIVKEIRFLVNYLESKRLFPLGENRKIRKLMRPFLLYNKKSAIYYAMSCLPVLLSKNIYKRIYHNSISGEEQ